MPLRVDCAFGFSCPPSTRCLPHRSGYKCPGEECPMSRDFVCNNDIQCYETWHKCDDQNECEDGTDELECPKTMGGSSIMISAIVPTIIIIVVTLMIVTMAVVIWRRRNRTSYRQAEVVNLQGTHIQSHPLNVQMTPPTYYHPGQHTTMQISGNYPTAHYPPQQHPPVPPAYSEAQNYYPRK